MTGRSRFPYDDRLYFYTFLYIHQSMGSILVDNIHQSRPNIYLVVFIVFFPVLYHHLSERTCLFFSVRMKTAISRPKQ